jgi:pyruvate,water dikinase
MIRWLNQINLDDLPQVGGKAANLGAMTQAGFPVPPGFCMTTRAWRVFAESCHADEALHEAQASDAALPAAHAERIAERLRERIEQAPMPPEIAAAVAQAYGELSRRLRAEYGQIDKDATVAVRSSSTTEDMPTASFAGQQDTFLNVKGIDHLLHSVRSCWASLWSARALQYRRRNAGERDAEMAVVVQAMIPCDVAGVAFSIDPLAGDEVTVIEAVPELGEALMNGSAEPVRLRVWPDGAVEVEPPQTEILTTEQARELATTVRQLADHFGRPQDVEWGYHGDRLYVFQARPITVQPEQFFNQRSEGANQLWTAAFLNERFPDPVSPLGWSVVQALLEPLAYRDPLHYLGVHDLDDRPITRLYRGHPYTDAGVFWRIYKLFPSALLPEDAVRYFPDGETGLRKTVPTPRWGFRLLKSLLRAAILDWRNWSPLHNWSLWQQFVPRHKAEMAQLTAQAEVALTALAEEPHNVERRLAVCALLEAGQSLSRELLGIHRWSLVHADLTYTLLRRLCRKSFGPEDGARVAAQQVAHLHTRSFLLDEALRRLVEQARENDPFQLASRTADSPRAQRFRAGMEQFLAEYGHRSFSLDLYHPTFHDDPSQVLGLIRELAQDTTPATEVTGGPRPTQGESRRLRLMTPLIRLTQRYILLREEQRFYWQRTLALQRRLVVGLGQALAQAGQLAHPDDVFFLTLDELRQAVVEDSSAWLEPARRRRQAHSDLCAEQRLAPALAYPEFLRGDEPVLPALADGRMTFRGRPVSPGIGRGPARVIHSPGDFDKLRPGDILVTTSPDPGWTPVFGIIAGLVMERGGQLSHGAVVAREYGLPAVAGLSGITGLLQDGEPLLVDGRTGIVQRETALLRRQAATLE